MTPTTILFFESHSGFFYGAQQSLHLLLTHLDHRRFRSVFVGPEEGLLTRRLGEAGIKTIVSQPDARMRRYGGAVLRESAWKKSTLIYPYLAYAWRIKKIIDEERAEIVYCNSSRAVLTVGLAARMAGVPLIWHLRLNHELGWWNRVVRGLADRIIVVSESLRENFPTGPGKRGKFVTVYNGIDLSSFASEESPAAAREELGIAPGWQVVGMTGDLTPRKGQLDLLRAACTVIRARPRTKFVIVGEAMGSEGQAYAEELRAYAAASDLTRHVLFTGWRSDIARVLRGLDLFVLPSWNEGLPRAVLEAMALSLPVIATTVGGNSELVLEGETGLLVPPGDPDALARAMLRILEDTELGRAMGRRGRERIEVKFTLEAATRGVEEAIDALLAARRRHPLVSPPPGVEPEEVRSLGTKVRVLRRLRVLHVVSVPGIGGAQIWVEIVVRRLSQLGYRVGVVCNDEPALIARYAPSAEVFPMAIPYGFSLRADLEFFLRLLRLLRREAFDLIQTSAAKASLYGRLAARLAGVPVVVFSAHGFPFHEFMHPLPRWALINLERFMSRWCTDMVMSMTEADARDAVTAGIVPAGRITTIHAGVELNGAAPGRQEARRALGLESDVPVIGMVGRLSRQKAPEDFLQVAARVAREFPQARFLVVGDGPLRDPLERLSASLGIADRVSFLGFRDDVPRVMAALDVFLLSSLWEALPSAILEAMAAAKPVVATALSGVAEAVLHGRTGLLAPPRDTAQLASHVVSLLRDPASARAMGEAGRRRIGEHFFAERMVGELSDLYQRLYQMKRAGVDRPLSDGSRS